jgi:ABC-type nickel/cobalt efflux system permease component RcnA
VSGIIFLGLLLGMQHALEADHLAAIWGLGHMTTLSVFAGAVLLSQRAVSPALAQGLELAVGVMLILLGSNVLYRLIRERVHIHVHRHGDGRTHIHAHSHGGESRPHRQVPHDHVHPPGFPLRSLLVGMMQGLAGSAALVVLAATALGSPLEGLGYVLLFGLGSVLGMALLSAVISVPLSLTANYLTWAHRGIRGAAGAVSILLGGVIVL